jgi:predicted metalloendopeptidase
MGSVIGHELSHMLDHHGLYWDGQGNYKPDGIISPEGMRQFYNKSDCVIEQYGPAPSGCEREDVSYGNNTVGEDLADLTGIKTAYHAMLLSDPALTLGDRQHFFMVLAQAFCESYDQEHVCDAVLNDVHAIAEFRIDRTFRNLRVFHDTFQCHPGHEMWRNETCVVY